MTHRRRHCFRECFSSGTVDPNSWTLDELTRTAITKQWVMVIARRLFWRAKIASSPEQNATWLRCFAVAPFYSSCAPPVAPSLMYGVWKKRVECINEGRSRRQNGTSCACRVMLMSALSACTVYECFGNRTWIFYSRTEMLRLSTLYWTL